MYGDFGVGVNIQKMKLVTAHQMQEIDRHAIGESGVPSLELMENAGSRVAEIILKKIDKTDPVFVICGKGNNGGDGLVVARLLLNAGIPVEVALVSKPDALSKDAVHNLKELMKLRPKIFSLENDKNLTRFTGTIENSKYIVDAIFGTGLNSPVRGLYEKVITKINSHSKPVISIDIPSGLSSDTGEVLGAAVRSRITVTFGLPKVGMMLGSGSEYIRELYVVDIGFPKDVIDREDTRINLITPELFLKYFGDRKADSHKNDFGHVFVIAGSTAKMGAGYLTSKAALRSGAGLVTYGLASAAFTRFDGRYAEVMVEPVSDKKKGYLITDSLNDVKKICHGKDVVAFGPGIGTHRDTAAFTKMLVSKLALPLVIDADGLNNLTGDLQLLEKRHAPTVLTPHPGEMAGLTGKDKKVVQKERLKIASDFSKKHRVVLLLKGHRTIVASPEGEIYINPTGNPGMASAGMGDALTGMIAAFIAQKIPPTIATCAAAYIHGLSGDIAAAKKSEIALIASDLIESIPDAITIIRNYKPGQRII